MNQSTQRNRGFGLSDNTAEEFDNEVTIDLVRTRLEKIDTAIEQLGATHTAYIVGMGAQHQRLYQEIDRVEGARVLFCESILSGIMRLLSPIIASYRGLVRIEASSALVPVFELLTERAMAGIYICSKQNAADFEASVKSHCSSQSYEYGIKSDAEYFFYVIDADNAESRTGIYEIVSYGKCCASILRI